MVEENIIRDLRRRIEWTQAEMAYCLGVDRSTIAHMEAGRPIRGSVRRLLDILIKAEADGNIESLRPDLFSGDAR